MIFRKPYAFLIKNFKKIHIVVLLLCVFVYFKVNSIMKFVKEFIHYRSEERRVGKECM